MLFYQTLETGADTYTHRKNIKGAVPNKYLNTPDVLQRCEELIDQMIEYRGGQNELDNLYDEYVSLYQREMDTYLRELSVTPKSKRAA